MRRTRCLGASAAVAIAAAFLATARATTTTVMVDDGDPSIEYRGSWVHNAIDDPKGLNYDGSTTFTNATGSTASYRFRGTGIAVYGAFEVAGTFAMHSSYSIDGGAPTDFLPAGTVVRPAYRQKFFQSAPLADGAHTLVITNLEREFWLDYLLVAQSSATAAATTAAAPASTSTRAAPQEAQTPPTTQNHSTAQAAPSATGPGTTASFAGTQSGFSPSSQTSQGTSTHSFSNTNNVTLTSTDAAALPPSDTDSAAQSQTSDLASGVASPTGSTAAHAHFPAGAIAGVAVGGLLVLTLAGVVGYRCRRRKQARRRRPDLTPYDPGLTALALEQSEKRDRGHNSDAASRGSTATSVRTLPLPLPRSALANATHSPTRASESSGARTMPHEIRTTDLDVEAVAAGEMSGGSGDRRTGFEPLGSPSSASPLLSRTRMRKDSPVTPGCYGSPLVVDLDQDRDQDERRRSVDGGVRLAGGPPDAENARREDDARSGVSTLPPAYRVYPAA